MSSSRITALFSGPKSVSVGGKPRVAWEARMKDIAALQGWLDALNPDPYPSLMESLEGAAGEEERNQLLFGALDHVQDNPPPAFGDATATRLFATPGGMIVFLTVALRLETTEEAAEVYRTITAREFVALRHVFFGLDSVSEINRMLLGPPPATAEGEEVSWSQAVHEVAAEHGWTYETVFDLPLRQFKNARRRGQPEPLSAGEIEVPMHELAARQDALCRKRYGMSAKEYFASLPPDEL